MTVSNTVAIADGRLEYHPILGDIWWVKSKSNRVKIGKPIRQPKSFRNYIQVRIDGKLKVVHRLIWEAIHSAIPLDREINHINGDKADNRLCNLELVTHQENMAHAKATGLTPHLTRTERPLIGVASDGRGLFFKNSSLAKLAGFHNTTLCAQGKRPSDKGFSWTYL